MQAMVFLGTTPHRIPLVGWRVIAWGPDRDRIRSGRLFCRRMVRRSPAEGLTAPAEDVEPQLLMESRSPSPNIERI